MQLMVVDDESIVLTSLRYLLASVGIEAETFLDPIAALEEFERRPNAFDGVVTDLAMPRMRGSELAHAIWQRVPDMPIAILSGLVDESDCTGKPGRQRDLCMLSKPSELAEILDALRCQGLRLPVAGSDEIRAAEFRRSFIEAAGAQASAS